MKNVIGCLIFAAFVATAQAEDLVINLLGTNVAACRDEIFTFRVTYSDVHLGKTEFGFTQTMLDKEEGDGSYKVVMKCALPLSILKASDRHIMTNEGIGKNTLVRIMLPDTTPHSVISAAIKVTTETTDRKGNKKKESIDGGDSNECDIYFSDVKTAMAWNDALTKRLK
jgi:hypothetical protein